MSRKPIGPQINVDRLFPPGHPMHAKLDRVQRAIDVGAPEQPPDQSTGRMFIARLRGRTAHYLPRFLLFRDTLYSSLCRDRIAGPYLYDSIADATYVFLVFRETAHVTPKSVIYMSARALSGDPASTLERDEERGYYGWQTNDADDRRLWQLLCESLLGFAVCTLHRTHHTKQLELLSNVMMEPRMYLEINVICARKSFGRRLINAVEAEAAKGWPKMTASEGDDDDDDVMSDLAALAEGDQVDGEDPNAPLPLLLDAIGDAIPFYRSCGFRFSFNCASYPTESERIAEIWETLVWYAAYRTNGIVQTDSSDYHDYLKQVRSLHSEALVCPMVKCLTPSDTKSVSGDKGVKRRAELGLHAPNDNGNDADVHIVDIWQT
jgi:hypothetical protein